MFEKSRIDKGIYWDRAWTLISGCTPCSPGCRGCWSASMSHRFTDKFTCYIHANESTPKRPCGWPQFNGHIQIHPERLDIPLRRKKPTVYAVWNDLFHEGIQTNFIKYAWKIMGECPQHIFLVLTKRAKRLPEIAHWLCRQPSKNIWLGCTVVNQQEADQKISALRSIPAAVRFVSVEPMLEQIDLCLSPGFEISAPYGNRGIHWVIAGGESGPGARPMRIEWARSVVEQCRTAGVPVFIKQIHINGKLSKNMAEWPEDLRIREIPEVKK